VFLALSDQNQLELEPAIIFFVAERRKTNFPIQNNQGLGVKSSIACGQASGFLVF
jgi:hypothetical protein